MKFLQIVCIVILLLLGTRSSVFAQDATAAAEVSPTPVPEYSLPYPGILPDSPFYFLKVTRDRIISLLISDSLKKAEFDLLQADKRLGGGMGLVEKDNLKLAESTFSKGLNYFESAIINTEEGKREGKDIKSLGERLMLSLITHKGVFDNLQHSSPEEFKKQVKVFQNRVSAYEKRVSALVPQE